MDGREMHIYTASLVLLLVVAHPFSGLAQEAQFSTSADTTPEIGFFDLVHQDKHMQQFQSVTGNGATGWEIQNFNDGIWETESKGSYEYNSDSTEVDVRIKGIERHEDEPAPVEFRFSPEGRPFSFALTYINDGQIFEEFYYNEQGLLDSVNIDRHYFVGLLADKKQFHYLSEDSIEVTHSFSYGEREGELTGYIVQKEEDLKEVVQKKGKKYRHTYFDVTFDALLQQMFQEFFFVEFQTEVFDDEKGQWVLTRKQTVTEQDNSITVLHEAYENGSVNRNYKTTYYRENGKITEKVIQSGNGGEFENQEMVLYRYGISVANEVPGEIAKDIKLSQNYPNPFNPSTMIRYQLPAGSYVSLKVFDLLGREVATLVDRRQSAGQHQVTFNADNLSAGVYIYRLETPSQILTRKLTLLK